MRARVLQVTAMFQAFSLSIAQLADRAIIRVLLRSLALTFLIFAVLTVAMVFGARAVAQAYGYGQEGGLAAGVLAAIIGIAATWLLFRAIAIPVMGIFADDVVAAVEAKHYPDEASTARPVSMATGLKLALGSLARLIGFNLIALPLYLILLVTGIGPFILFLALNAILLGRDLAEMVAVRHLDPLDLRYWMRMTRGRRAVLGGVVTGLLMLPLINLFAPLIGAAMATHLFHMKDIT
jgi:CysZ protein